MKDLTDDILFKDPDQEAPFVDESKSKVEFICPNCKKITRDDVIFLCNICQQSDLIHKDGIYMCPSCLIPGENFECMLCGSTEVKMVAKKHHQKN